VAGTGPATEAWDAARKKWMATPQGYFQVVRWPFCSSPAWGDGVVAVNDYGSETAYAGRGRKGAPGSPGPEWEGNAMVGLDAETGAVLWRVEGCAGRISSPIRWRVDGKDYFVSGGPKSVVCVEAKTGAERWRVEGTFRTVVDPTVAGDLLVTIGDPRDQRTANKAERLALAAYRITPEKAEKLWDEEPWTGHAHGDSPLVHRGHVYFQNRMWDVETGSKTNSGARQITMGTSLIGGDWFFHYGNAQELGTNGTVTATSKLPAFGGESFISPTYADGRLYIRGTIPGSTGGTAAQRIAKGLPPEHGCVYCFDLRK
jgi:outer membrane protein assembly factor BamB